MTIEIRTATNDDLPALWASSRRAFGGKPPKPEHLQHVAEALDIDRWLVALDGERVVGTAGSIGFELTLPGPTPVPLFGICTATVAASHRRQGILSRFMSELDARADAFDAPVLGLYASEGAIYERFGFGPSTQYRVAEIDTRRASIHPRWDPETVELALADDHLDRILAIWDRCRLNRVGGISRTERFARIELLDPDEPTYAALHDDGFALYEIQEDWRDGDPGHTITVTAFGAATPAAHLALWHHLLSVDLVATVRSIRAVPIDDPLPGFLTDPRALRTVALNDALWLKVADPVAAFGRRFEADGYGGLEAQTQPLRVGLVESIDDLIGGVGPSEGFQLGPDGCDPWRADEEPDLIATRSALGPLLLGNRATGLAATHRLTGRPEAVARADLIFGSATAPFSTTAF